MYAPNLGRFMQNDPIGFSAGDANLFRYVSNSPVNLNDPSGLAGVITGITITDNATNLPEGAGLPTMPDVPKEIRDQLGYPADYMRKLGGYADKKKHTYSHRH